jgi:DNA-binding HxlR family transcriptional regulator
MYLATKYVAPIQKEPQSMSIPRPGKPVRGSHSGKAIMALFDLMGRRWAMGIIWQLAGGPFAFTELQKKCESISPTILSSRLKDLSEAALIEQTLKGYQLTILGQNLFTLLQPFKQFAGEWSDNLEKTSEDI